MNELNKYEIKKIAEFKERLDTLEQLSIARPHDEKLKKQLTELYEIYDEHKSIINACVDFENIHTD